MTDDNLKIINQFLNIKDTFRIDSLYSPVKKVSYSVSTAREGKALDYDKLTMEVETNGSISAEDAVAYSARIFQDQLKMFVNFDEPVEAPVKEVSTEPEFNKNLLIDMELSFRIGITLRLLQNVVDPPLVDKNIISMVLLEATTYVAEG